jgi:hypothetical protein
MNKNITDESKQPSCSRCGRAPDVVATKPGQTVFDLLLGVCPECQQTFCTDCASEAENGYACPIHKKELALS